MKIATSILFSIAVLALSSGQEKPASDDSVTPAIGLNIGQQAPAFALTEQFGHEQSNQTLKGLKGTVIVFFRSADW
jgi:cytochrome oxidase Cu insertion factor (SCO1/SenC/PrrC family)